MSKLINKDFDHHNFNNQYNEEMEDYNKAIEIDSECASAYASRGFAYLKRKQYKEAMEDYGKAIEIDPEDVSAILSFAETKILTGNHEGAMDSVKKAMSLPLDINHKALSLYLKCVAERLLDMNTSVSENELNEILKGDFTFSWSFAEIELWIKDIDIEENAKRFIKEKIELLKKHLLK